MQSELPWLFPWNSVESKLWCTTMIYFDNVTLMLHNVTLTSQKPRQHNNKCDCSKTIRCKWSSCFSIKHRYSDILLKYHNFIYIVDVCGRAKNWQKVAYLRRNPSPSVKWKTIVWMILQDVEVSWITGITFAKRGNGVKIGQNFIFRSEIANFWNPFAATDTRHRQRKTEIWALSFI